MSYNGNKSNRKAFSSVDDMAAPIDTTFGKGNTLSDQLQRSWGYDANASNKLTQNFIDSGYNDFNTYAAKNSINAVPGSQTFGRDNMSSNDFMDIYNTYDRDTTWDSEATDSFMRDTGFDAEADMYTAGIDPSKGGGTGMTGAEIGSLATDGVNAAVGVANYFQNKPILKEQLIGLKMSNEIGREKIDSWKRHDSAMRAAGLRD